jgi:DNA-binding NarL/FixJ family response regulator
MKIVTTFLITGLIFWRAIRFLHPSRNGLPFLSYREQQILSLMVEGYGDDEISDRLHISERTLANCIRNIPKRMNLPDISYAIDYALEKGLVSITYA